MALLKEDGTFLQVNPAFLEMLGYTVEEMALLSFIDITCPEDRMPSAENVSKLASGEIRSLSMEKRYLHKNGRTVLALVKASFLPGRGGLPSLFIAQVLDETARKKAEEELVRLNAELEAKVAERTGQLMEANRELEAFSYSVSHDLRAPLRAIDGFARILEEEHGARLGEEPRRLVGIVRRNARQMGTLIDSLLALSRIGRHSLEPEKVDMASLVLEAFGEIAPEGIENRPRLEMEPLPDAWGDRNLLKQVWVNLVGNAVKFSSGNPGPVVTIRGFSTEGETFYTVADNGIGFDMRHAEKLFRPFSRLHGPDDFEGTGIGLALAKRIVTRHGGTIRAEGKPGGAAAFTFSLPDRGPT
jgi:PAS domain S-box